MPATAPHPGGTTGLLRHGRGRPAVAADKVRDARALRERRQSPSSQHQQQQQQQPLEEQEITVGAG